MASGRILAELPGALAQGELLDLAGRRLGDLGENDRARALVMREALAAPGDEFLRSRRVARLHFDEGAGRLAPFLVRTRDHGGELDARMLEQGVLHIDRGDVLAARDDDVLRAVAELDVAVRMLDPEIAGVEPAAGEGLVGRRLVLEVALHHDVAAEHD